MWLDKIYEEPLTNFQNYWTYNSFRGELNPIQILIDLNPDGQNNSSKMFHIFGLGQNPWKKISNIIEVHSGNIGCIFQGYLPFF